jgi:response regulator RpfG family c-di-GMP phosphodiesterase
MELSFIIIDDSELDCFIARKIVAQADKSIAIKTFQNAQDAIKNIARNTEDSNKGTTINLLDLQMALMNGFEFVEEFENLPPGIKDRYMIVILSSTRNSNDISRILTYSSVHSLIEKPITREKLRSLILQGKTNF